MQVYTFEIMFPESDGVYVFERRADAVAFAEVRGYSEENVVEQTLISGELAAEMIAQEREDL